MDYLLLADVLEKCAQVISSLESEKAELQAKISTLDGTLGQIKEASDREVVTDLMAQGFSEGEAIKMVNTLPGSALEKIAHLQTNSPDWKLGSASDLPSSGYDPILDFINS